MTFANPGTWTATALRHSHTKLPLVLAPQSTCHGYQARSVKAAAAPRQSHSDPGCSSLTATENYSRGGSCLTARCSPPKLQRASTLQPGCVNATARPGHVREPGTTRIARSVSCSRWRRCPYCGCGVHTEPWVLERARAKRRCNCQD